jgi:hypothetical protein
VLVAWCSPSCSCSIIASDSSHSHPSHFFILLCLRWCFFSFLFFSDYSHD